MYTYCIDKEGVHVTAIKTHDRKKGLLLNKKSQYSLRSYTSYSLLFIAELYPTLMFYLYAN